MGGGKQVTKATKQLGSQVPIIGDSFENRREAFIKEVNTTGDKYQIALRPQLVYTREGIVPQYVYLDVKEASKQPEKKEKPNNSP